jgi:hypothetical protein
MSARPWDIVEAAGFYVLTDADGKAVCTTNDRSTAKRLTLFPEMIDALRGLVGRLDDIGLSDWRIGFAHNVLERADEPEGGAR